MGKKIPPNPPKRQDSESNELTTTVEIHHVQTSSPLPLPAYPSSDSLSISLDNQGKLFSIHIVILLLLCPGPFLAGVQYVPRVWPPKTRGNREMARHFITKNSLLG